MTSTDPQYSAGTVDDNARDKTLYSPDFMLAGKKSGHGAVAWLPAPDYDMPAPKQPWPPGQGRHPVIALLDSAVDQAHSWLPESASPPFVTDAKAVLGWPGPDLPQTGPVDDKGRSDVGSHGIHGTFNAGLIRQHARDARIVSMPVMNIRGKVEPADVISALTWLADQHVHVDIVLMPFGTPADASDPDQVKLNEAMLKLGHVQFVCSAGNEGSDRTVFPAAFSVDKKLNVASVGAVAVGAPTERAPYSNYGPWVTTWRNGTNVISLAPLTTTGLDDKEADALAGLVPYTVAKTGHGYAWWSGTSFAAVLHAADLANQMSATGSYPDPAAGS